MERINYIQRNQIQSRDISQDIKSISGAPPKSTFFHIMQINAPDKKEELNNKKQERIIFEDLLTGMQASLMPIAFHLLNEKGKTSIYVGTMAEDEAMLNLRSTTLKALLMGSNQYIAYKEVLYQPVRNFEKAGLVLGLPTSKIESDPDLPIDRLLRALGSFDWQCLILAEPNDDTSLNDQINKILVDLRQTQTVTQDRKVPNPISDHYCELLKAAIKHMQLGKEIGSWAVSVYLSGNKISYYQLASLWKSIYSGEQSKPHPIFVTEEASINSLLQKLQSIPKIGEPGPVTALFRHPFQYKSILNSRQLSAYIHFPKVETPGIALIKMNELDTMPQIIEAPRSIVLGTVMQRRQLTQEKYVIDLQDLSSHAFVTGTTGSGKTTTIFKLLVNARQNGGNFLVIESAKKEYRSLKRHPLLKDLQVFTLGNENIAPFRLNPFEVPLGMPVSTHLDLLRSVFNASFGMWTPLPQVLEQCLYKIYEDRGWDLSYNENSRNKSAEDRPFSFPTLTDLYNKIEDVCQNLGYDEKTSDEIKAALKTRINSLRTGGKGKMLDTQVSFPMEQLLNAPTVLEMEGIGDDEDKAFIIGIVFIRLVEHRRTTEKKEVPHLLVIEEAHRLLSNVQAGNREQSGNSKAKAVETFTDILAEIRSYNQGIIVADQIPTKLAPEIIKNTNLKIIHRIISNDDRQVLAGSIGMDERQSVNFITLTKGKTVIFSQGDDSPLLVDIDKVDIPKGMPSDDEIRDDMKPRIFPYYKDFADDLKEARLTATRIAEAKDVQRIFMQLAISLMEEDYSIDFLYPALVSKIQSYVKEGENTTSICYYTIIQLAEWSTTRMGDQQGWGYSLVNELRKRLANLLIAKINNKDFLTRISEYRDWIQKLHYRSQEPYTNCGKLCADKDKKITCLYRYPVQETFSQIGGVKVAFQNWQNLSDSNNYFEDAARMAIDVAKILIPKKQKKEATLKASMCFAIQMSENLTSEPFPDEFEKLVTECKKQLDIKT